MKRGEIFYADLNPTIGAEINKKRPVLIISNDANNKGASTVTVLPITSNITHIYPFEVALDKKTGLPKMSKVQCQQIRTISKLRINTQAIGKVDKDVLRRIEVATRLHLGFS